MPHREDYATENKNTEERNKKAFLDYMMTVNQKLNNKDTTQKSIKTNLEGVVELEYALSSVEMTPGDHRIAAHEAHEVSVKELDKSFGQIKT